MQRKELGDHVKRMTGQHVMKRSRKQQKEDVMERIGQQESTW